MSPNDYYFCVTTAPNNKRQAVVWITAVTFFDQNGCLCDRGYNYKKLCGLPDYLKGEAEACYLVKLKGTLVDRKKTVVKDLETLGLKYSAKMEELCVDPNNGDPSYSI
jgi:hypothetical protein